MPTLGLMDAGTSQRRCRRCGLLIRLSGRLAGWVELDSGGDTAWGAPVKDWPQAMQNLASGGETRWHCGHTLASLAPQWRQKLASAGFSRRQDGQVMVHPPATHRPWSPDTSRRGFWVRPGVFRPHTHPWQRMPNAVWRQVKK